MTLKRRKWYLTDGPRFLKECGIHTGFRALDFGARAGNYAVPLARAAGKRGNVYAFDRDRGALAGLRRKARRYGLENIETVPTDGSLPLPWPDGFFDAVLTFDVLHYFEDRGPLYAEIRRILKPAGLYCVYPKHTRGDMPNWNLADLTPDDVRREIAGTGFRYTGRVDDEISHDNGFTRGYALKFIKKR